MKRHSTSWNIRYMLNIYARFAMLSVFLRLYEVPASPNNQLNDSVNRAKGQEHRKKEGKNDTLVRVSLKR